MRYVKSANLLQINELIEEVNKETLDIPKILLYTAVGLGLLIAHLATRKPRKRTSRNSPEKEGKEEL